MKHGIKIKKVDRQGSIILPREWRKGELKDADEVFVKKGILKIIPKRKPDLTKYFDSVDLGVDSIEDWEDFEREFYEVS